MDDDAEIIAEFLVESHENLDQVDRDLVELEQDPGDRELLSRIFRAMHTIKGTSGFLALPRLESLTHVGEHLLSRLRDGELELTQPTTEVLLRLVDTVRALLHAVEHTQSDAERTIDVDAVVGSIRVLLDDPGPLHLEPHPPSTAAPAEAEVGGQAEAGAPVGGLVGTWSGEGPKLGELLVESGVVSPEQIGRAMAEQLRGDDRPLGELLVELGAVTQAEIEATLAAQKATALAALGVAEGAEAGAKRRVVEATVRVDVELLDSLVQLVGELVLTRNQVVQKVDSLADPDLLRATQRLNVVASELQEGVMRTRMQPIGQMWSKMPRLVRDLAHQLGRKVNLEMDGHETELDRSLLEALKGPLTHLVRNALDHGLEPPDERERRGKPVEGRLSLRAYHESGQVVVEISDDGRGVDVERVATIAVARGVVTGEQLRTMDPRDVQNLIFRPGFSTAAEVTNVSGRGVGLDVVSTNIEGIGGSVDLISRPGVGTTCRVRIPLTLAIIPALLVSEGGERYAIPQANLVELVRVEEEERARVVQMIAGAPVLRLRGRLLPLVSLAGALQVPDAQGAGLTIVVLQAEDIRFGLAVREVHDTQEIVVKPLGRQLKTLGLYAGATIMGDGRVSLILDVAGLALTHRLEATPAPAAEPASGGEDEAALLVLEASPGRRAALPLRAISRLEEFPLSRVERSGSVEVVQYRDGILPLVRLAPAIGLAETTTGRDLLSVVVLEDGERRTGLVIDRVLDIVQTTLTPSDAGRRPGVLGSAVVHDQVTDLVDLDAVVALAGVGS